MTEFVVAPSQIAYVRRLGQGLCLGLGYFMPRSENYVLREALNAGIQLRGSAWQIAGAVTEAQHVGAAALGYGLTSRIRFREVHGVDVFRAGRAGVALAYRFSKGWASAEIDVQPALRRGEVDRITLVNGRAGIYFAFASHVALGAGFFTDRLGDRQRWVLVSGGGDFYGGTLGIELSNEHLLAPNERVKSLVFSSVFAIRYAFSAGDIGRTEVDPKLIRDVESENGPFVAKRGDMNVHEVGLYVGSGLRF